MSEPVIIVLAWSLGLPAVIFAILGADAPATHRRCVTAGRSDCWIRLQDLEDHEPPAERRRG